MLAESVLEVASPRLRACVVVAGIVSIALAVLREFTATNHLPHTRIARESRMILVSPCLTECHMVAKGLRHAGALQLFRLSLLFEVVLCTMTFLRGLSRLRIFSQLEELLLSLVHVTNESDIFYFGDIFIDLLT